MTFNGQPLPYNPLDDTDSYKDTHDEFYPPDMDQLYSHLLSRGGVYDETLMFGTQSYVRHLVEHPITMENVEEEEEFCQGHGTVFNTKGWTRVVNEFGGNPPIQIRALDEGLLVPTQTPLASIQSKRGFQFVTSYYETSMVAHMWPSITVATRIFNMKKKLAPFYERTSDTNIVDAFAVLNFGARGSKGRDDVRLTGAAHLAMFQGTDSKLAVRFVNHYYDSPMSGYSVRATEHSVMCAWGSDGVETLRALLAKCPRGSILSVVGDTWNIFTFARAAASMAQEFKDAGVIFVCRPDSGVIGELLHELIRILADSTGFGTITNKKGFYLLDGAKVLWADGVDEVTFVDPWVVAEKMRFAADTVFVGSGGGLVQKGIDRDTCKFAFKASALRRQGSSVWEGIAKDPITDQGKKSRKGRFCVVRVPSGLLTMDRIPHNDIQRRNDLLRLRYDTGDLHNQTTIDAIRQTVDVEIVNSLAT